MDADDTYRPGDVIWYLMSCDTGTAIVTFDMHQDDLRRGRRYVIGRGRDADLVLTDTAVGRRHAAIEWVEGEGPAIVDGGTYHGISVNGERVDAHHSRLLRENDEITLGRVTLKVIRGMVDD